MLAKSYSVFIYILQFLSINKQ